MISSYGLTYHTRDPNRLSLTQQQLNPPKNIATHHHPSQPNPNAKTSIWLEPIGNVGMIGSITKRELGIESGAWGIKLLAFMEDEYEQ